MSGGAILRSILTGSPTPTDAGDKVRPDEADERDQFPFIVFHRTRVERVQGLDNTILGTGESFAIECWAETPAKAQVIEAQVVQALHDAGWPVTPNDPDGKDPNIGVNVAVVNVDIWT